jgi:nicotinamide mononucleotide (NMN) deamidase PncC
MAVAITGVTGPEPDEDGKPVDLIYCGVMCNGGATKHIRLELEKSDPNTLIQQSCVAALYLLRGFAFS